MPMTLCGIDHFCSNDDPELNLTYFTARSNLDPFVFVWENA